MRVRRTCWGASILIGFCFATLVGCGVSSNSVLISPSSVLLAPGQSFQFNIERLGNSASNDAPQPVLLVNGLVGGSATAGTITPSGLYTAPSTTSGQAITVRVRGQSSSAAVALFNAASFAGSVTTTQNPLVASYSIAVPANTPVHVQFGPDTSYGLLTSSLQTPNGGEVTILVAGMRASTTYHMQAVTNLANGSEVLDTDHPFTTGSIPANRIPNITAQQFGSGTPNPGIELFSFSPSSPNLELLSAVATDLEGNVIWYYDVGPNYWPYPIKPLPNGHMLVNPTQIDNVPGINEIREVDLAGNIVNRVTLDAVNQGLAGLAAKFQVIFFHHDVAVLPNGHWILLANYSETINDVPGIPAGTAMTGDALIDWDPQHGPVWAWSAFDHLDLTHAPYGFADWTHSNAVIYSPDDGNLLLSMRNQNWIIKINYQNGAGDGSILWHFGESGDFTLPTGEAPIDWNYGQHYPTIVSPNSSGVFSLMFFDNGNSRFMDSNNDVCGTAGVGPCYSNVPIFQLDESAKTATLLWQDDLLPSYSICCGDAMTLPNGDYEFDIAYDVNTPNFSHIEEVTPSTDLVWKMDIEGQLAYRGFRIPSLYPGQVWNAALPETDGAPHHTGSSTKASASPKTVKQLP
jgi:arylsulfate sulfotransferase